MLSFRDFVPKDDTPMLAISRRIEPIGGVLARLNAWVAENSIDVINIETLLMPEGATPADVFSNELQLNMGPLEISGTRMQVLRVWYRRS